MKKSMILRRKGGAAGVSLFLSAALVFNMIAPYPVFADPGCGHDSAYICPCGEHCLYCDDCPAYSRDERTEARQCTDDPIDTKSGNNFFTEERLSIPCPGVSIELDLGYRSIASVPQGRLGQGWLHSYEWGLETLADRAIVYTGTGDRFIFFEGPNGTYRMPESNNWTLEENATGHTLEMPGGMTYSFDSNGRLTGIHDAWGTGLECAYGTNDCLEAVTHANGRSLVFSNVFHTASSEWRVSSIQVPGGASLTFDYNDSGQFTRIIEQVDANSYTSSYQYAGGYLTNKVNGVGFESVFAYEAGTGKGTHLAVDGYYDHDVEYVDADTTDVSYATRGAEQVFRYARNTDGTLDTKYGPADSAAGALSLGVSYAYAENGIDTTEETVFDDHTGATWSEWKLYDDAHNITNRAVSYCTTNPVHSLSTEYDPAWLLPSALVDPEGHRTETVYTNGSPLVEKAFFSDTDSFDTHYSYTTNGLVQAVTNANGHVTRFDYDSMGNKISAAAELGPITTNTYSSLGYLTRVETLSENGSSTGRITQYENDAKGRTVLTTYADGLTSSNAYNALGYLVQSIDRAGRATDYTYAPGKKLTSTTRYLCGGETNMPVRIGYDLDEQVVNDNYKLPLTTITFTG